MSSLQLQEGMSWGGGIMAAVLMPGESEHDYGSAILSAVATERFGRGCNSFVVGRIVEVCTERGHMLSHRDVGQFFQNCPSFEHVNGSGKGEKFRIVGGLP